MEALLHMPYHLQILMILLELLDQHIGGRVPCFKHKDKVIKITKEMVDKIFDFPGSTVRFIDSSDDLEVKAEVAELRSKYTDHRNKIPINKIEKVMLSDQSEEGFMRSFAFYFIASILCPASYCFASSKYLYSLRDVSAIPSLDFGTLGLEFMLEESDRHSEMIFNRPNVEEMNKPSHIGGCLPIWGIIYLDFIDFDANPNNQSTVDYSLPRICHIKNEDFQYLALVDRNYQSRKSFGVLPLRHISQTPYASTVPINNVPDAPPVFPLVHQIEVNNDNNVSETPIENTPIKAEVDVKVKAETLLKSEFPSEEALKQETVVPKAENIMEAETKVPINSLFKTPNIPIRASNLNTNSIREATTSQPKEEVNPSMETSNRNIFNGVNAKRSFVLISSSSSVDREKLFHTTPIIIDDDSPFTPAAAGTSQQIPTSDREIAMAFADQLGSSRFNDT